jgi:hypothetical protein
MACYDGPNPIDTPEKRRVIWDWARPMIDQGIPMDKIAEAINQRWFKGRAPDKWIYDILSGRKTPYSKTADALWRAQKARRDIAQQAENFARQESLGPAYKMLHTLFMAPRALATLGHWTVFPFTHAGDLAFRPASWKIFGKGLLDTWTKSTNAAATERLMTAMEHDPRFTLGLRSGVDMGKHSHPTGLLGTFKGPSKNAWDILTVMRFELWKSAMDRVVKPEMNEEELLDMGRQMATWANHATGSGKGALMHPNVAPLLFGPKLTQSKINRIIGDPIETVKTFAKGNRATPAEKAVAWKRFSGMVQMAGTQLAFLAINQGINAAIAEFTGSKKKDDINWKNPNRADWLAFKVFGLNVQVPGVGTEIRTIAKILATQWATPKELRGESRREHVSNLIGQYEMNKATPSIGLGIELGSGQNWMGRPLPGFLGRGQKGTPKRPSMTWTEFAGEHAPIPLEGPIGYFYDKMKDHGMSALDATTVTKGLIMFGLDVSGLQVQEEKEPASKK